MSDDIERSVASAGSHGGAVCDRITAYLFGGGLFNPEMANHDAVRDLLIDSRTEIERLRLTSAERTIIEWAAASLPPGCHATLRELLERTK
jgi:hypothetical protein